MHHPRLYSLLLASAVWGVFSLRDTTIAAPPDSVTAALIALTRAATVYDEPAMIAAIAELARIGRPSLNSVQLLLAHDESNVRWKAIQTLGMLGIADPPLCQRLATCARDVDADVRGASLDVMSQLFPNHRHTRLATERLLTDPHPLVRVRAAASQWTTRQDLQAITLLARALEHPDWMAAQEASRRLSTIGTPATPALLALLRSPHIRVQRSALLTLANFSAPPPNVLPTISSLTQAADPLLATAAMRALLACGAAGRAQLVALCDSSSVLHRIVSVKLLSESGISTPVWRRLLVRRLDDPVPSVQLAALGALSARDDVGLEMRSRILHFLDSSSSDHRAAAIAALHSLGGCAVVGIPQLRKLAADDPVDYIRRAAHDMVAQLKNESTNQMD